MSSRLQKTAKAGKPAQAKTNPKPKSNPKPKKPNRDAEQDARLRKLEARTAGPQVKESWTTSVNLGTVNGVDNDEFTRVAHVFLNPALLRDVGFSDATNPTAVRAAQYAMYRVHRAKLVMHSLVGSAGVAGTVAVAALQLDSSKGAATSFDAVAARSHITCSIGRTTTFTPKLPTGDASWFYTDTKAHTGAEALGLGLEVFLLGSTGNIYTNQPYTGGLWRLTLEVTYQFSNYRPDLALANLSAGQESHELTVQTDEKGDVVVSTEKPLLGAAFHTAQPGIADVVLSIVDVAGGLASQIPIIGPLLDTGLGFLKPLFGRSRDGGEHQYLLCGSFDEAKAGDALTLSQPVHVTVQGDFRLQQLTPANLNGGAGPAPGPGPGPGPLAPCTLPQETVRITIPDKYLTHFGITAPTWTERVEALAGNDFRLVTAEILQGSYTESSDVATHNEWQLPAYANQKVFRWRIVTNGVTSGANAIITHTTEATQGSSGLLGTFAALAANPTVIPRVTPSARSFGWATVQSCNVEGVSPGSLVIPVHYNNWFRPAGHNGRYSRLGWLFLEPSTKTVQVVGAYELPTGVNDPGNGVAHFYTFSDTRGFWRNRSRNIEQGTVPPWILWEEQ